MRISNLLPHMSGYNAGGGPFIQNTLLDDHILTVMGSLKAMDEGIRGSTWSILNFIRRESDGSIAPKEHNNCCECFHTHTTENVGAFGLEKQR